MYSVSSTQIITLSGSIYRDKILTNGSSATLSSVFLIICLNCVIKIKELCSFVTHPT